MVADCHMHMVLDGTWWKDALARHAQKPDDGFIHTALEAGTVTVNIGEGQHTVFKQDFQHQTGVFIVYIAAPQCHTVVCRHDVVGYFLKPVPRR